jgi:hypothetical protein
LHKVQVSGSIPELFPGGDHTSMNCHHQCSHSSISFLSQTFTRSITSSVSLINHICFSRRSTLTTSKAELISRHSTKTYSSLSRALAMIDCNSNDESHGAPFPLESMLSNPCDVSLTLILYLINQFQNQFFKDFRCSKSKRTILHDKGDGDKNVHICVTS